MREACVCVALLVAALGAQARASERAAMTVLHFDGGDRQSLRADLVALAQERLRPAGLSVDGQRAWMGLSGPLPKAGMIEVRPTWTVDAGSGDDEVPPLPLAFELRPSLHQEPQLAAGTTAGAPPIMVTLAVPLLREVWVAGRRLRKGSAVTCADFSLQRRDARKVPKQTLSLSCQVEPGSVALRDIAARDVVRSTDIGGAPQVTAGSVVRVSVATRGIHVSTTAIALADARVGDQIDVRLQRTTRTLKTRVTGPGSVELQDVSL